MRALFNSIATAAPSTPTSKHRDVAATTAPTALTATSHTHVRKRSFVPTVSVSENEPLLLDPVDISARRNTAQLLDNFLQAAETSLRVDKGDEDLASTGSAESQHMTTSNLHLLKASSNNVSPVSTPPPVARFSTPQGSARAHSGGDVVSTTPPKFTRTDTDPSHIVVVAAPTPTLMARSQTSLRNKNEGSRTPQMSRGFSFTTVQPSAQTANRASTASTVTLSGQDKIESLEMRVLELERDLARERHRRCYLELEACQKDFACESAERKVRELSTALTIVEEQRDKLKKKVEEVMSVLAQLSSNRNQPEQRNQRPSNTTLSPLAKRGRNMRSSSVSGVSVSMSPRRPFPRPSASFFRTTSRFRGDIQHQQQAVGTLEHDIAALKKDMERSATAKRVLSKRYSKASDSGPVSPTRTATTTDDPQSSLADYNISKASESTTSPPFQARTRTRSNTSPLFSVREKRSQRQPNTSTTPTHPSDAVSTTTNTAATATSTPKTNAGEPAATPSKPRATIATPSTTATSHKVVPKTTALPRTSEECTTPTEGPFLDSPLLGKSSAPNQSVLTATPAHSSTSSSVSTTHAGELHLPNEKEITPVANFDDNPVAVEGADAPELDAMDLAALAQPIVCIDSRGEPRVGNATTHRVFQPQQQQALLAAFRAVDTDGGNEDEVHQSAVQRIMQLRMFIPDRILRWYLQHVTLARSGQDVDSLLQARAFAEQYQAAVLFADISGFSLLAEHLEKTKRQSVAMRQLSAEVGGALAPLVRIILEWGGDVVKFAGDAIFAVFHTYTHGDSGSAALAACCAARQIVRSPLHNIFSGTTLKVHCGVGVGDVVGFHVGGVNNRWEYTISGPALHQATAAEGVAARGEVAISAEVLGFVQDAAEVEPANPTNTLFKLISIAGETLGQHYDRGAKKMEQELSFIPTTTLQKLHACIVPYVPRPVVAAVEQSLDANIAEVRFCAVLFVRLTSVPYTSPNHLPTFQNVIEIVQAHMFKFVGATFCRLLADEKGLSMLWVCTDGGTYPSLSVPRVSTSSSQARRDENQNFALSAVISAVQLRQLLAEMGERCCVGITAGRVFHGTVGGSQRCEYTMHGTQVNTAARLMGKANDGILCDENVFTATRDFIDFMPPVMLAIKGKDAPIMCYQPISVKMDCPSPPHSQYGLSVTFPSTDSDGGSRTPGLLQLSPQISNAQAHASTSTNTTTTTNPAQHSTSLDETSHNTVTTTQSPSSPSSTSSPTLPSHRVNSPIFASTDPTRPVTPLGVDMSFEVSAPRTNTACLVDLMKPALRSTKSQANIPTREVHTSASSNDGQKSPDAEPRPQKKSDPLSKRMIQKLGVRGRAESAGNLTRKTGGMTSWGKRPANQPQTNSRWKPVTVDE